MGPLSQTRATEDQSSRCTKVSRRGRYPVHLCNGAPLARKGASSRRPPRRSSPRNRDRGFPGHDRGCGVAAMAGSLATTKVADALSPPWRALRPAVANRDCRSLPRPRWSPSAVAATSDLGRGERFPARDGHDRGLPLRRRDRYSSTAVATGLPAATMAATEASSPSRGEDAFDHGGDCRPRPRLCSSLSAYHVPRVLPAREYG